MRLETHAKIVIIAAILLVLGGVFMSLPTLTGFSAYNINRTLQSNLTVASACVLNINTTLLNYSAGGSLNPGTDSDWLTVNVSNDGNADQNVTLNTTPFDRSGTVDAMPCNQTRFLNFSNNVSWDNMIGSCTNASTAILLYDNRTNPTPGADRGTSNVTSFKVRIPEQQTSGLYNQTMTFTSIC